MQTVFPAGVWHNDFLGAQVQCVGNDLSIEVLVEVAVFVEIDLFDFANEGVWVVVVGGGFGSFEFGFGGGEGVGIVVGVDGEEMAVFGIDAVFGEM